jgi:hypothetical protein
MRDLNDPAGGWGLGRPRYGRILLQGKVCPAFVIISQESAERASKRALIPHNHVIQATLRKHRQQTFEHGATCDATRGESPEDAARCKLLMLEQYAT